MKLGRIESEKCLTQRIESEILRWCCEVGYVPSSFLIVGGFRGSPTLRSTNRYAAVPCNCGAVIPSLLP